MPQNSGQDSTSYFDLTMGFSFVLADVDIASTREVKLPGKCTAGNQCIKRKRN